MKSALNVEEIRECLPHRYPFLLVDRILEMEVGKRIVGIKNVTINEPFFDGHFPERAIMPGVLIIEAMAQVGGILAYKSAKTSTEGKLVYLAGMDKVRFRKPVFPGDQIIFELEILHQGSRAYKMKGKAFVNKELVAEAEITAVLSE
ncbi:MAG: 3-hydroxyacyl-ACP dehydratase FabZ [Deltaproteobacteria bacterium]|nr:3-hydroxyacyl-ACP dehydratase FabZ [Deltaproteobacteria bacterium]